MNARDNPDESGEPLTEDNFQNFMSGFNTLKDPTIQSRAYLHIVPPRELEALYRGNWLAQKIIQIPAMDSTRAWRAWQADQKQITALEEAERELGIQRKLYNALIRSRLYGGAVMIMGIKGQDFKNELNLEQVGKGDLLFVHVVSRFHLGVGPLVRDITSKWYGQPTHYVRTNVQIVQPPGGVAKLEMNEQAGQPEFYIHPSRVIRLLGIEYPDFDYAPDSWGDSVLQPIYQAIRDASVISHAVAYMVNEAKLDIVKVKNLSHDMATPEGSAKLSKRWSNAIAAKSVVNALLIDTEEEWECRQLNIAALETVMQSFYALSAGGADIPATRLLSKSPDGMNATGDSDSRNYYDRLAADQITRLQPALTPLDEVLIRHALGSRPEGLHYRWNPLWQMPEDMQADIELKKAQAYQIDVQAMQINPEILREGRMNALMESGFLYPGLSEIAEGKDIEPDEEEIREMVQARAGQSSEEQKQGEHERGMEARGMESGTEASGPVGELPSGPAVMCTAQTGRTHERTQPPRRNVKKPLAPQGPSTHGHYSFAVPL